TASGYLATAMGLFNTASGALGSAIGYETTASGIWSSAYGFRSTASGFAALVVGTHADLDGNSGTSPPEEYASASGRGAVAVGGAVHADADYSSAFGVNARATAEGATAIGFGAVADRAYALSVGASGAENNIIHVADAIADTDAVNLRQAQSLNDALMVGLTG